jgi:hypothetical protein
VEVALQEIVEPRARRGSFARDDARDLRMRGHEADEALDRREERRGCGVLGRWRASRGTLANAASTAARQSFSLDPK